MVRELSKNGGDLVRSGRFPSGGAKPNQRKTNEPKRTYRLHQQKRTQSVPPQAKKNQGRVRIPRFIEDGKHRENSQDRMTRSGKGGRNDP